MAFTRFDEKDGAALYDTKESAIERAKMLKAWDNDPNTKIFIHRKWVPLWFAHFVQDTPLQWIAYEELEES
jgi:hypothetical protein